MFVPKIVAFQKIAESDAARKDVTFVAALPEQTELRLPTCAK